MKMTVHTPPSTPHILDVRNISAVTDPILNFKDRFLGLSLKNSNCQGDICQSIICQGDISPYQEYPIC